MKIHSHRPYYAEQLGIDDPDGVIRGIYIGSCVHERNSWSVWEGKMSHAHNYKASEWFGWICVLNPKDVLTPTGKMTACLAHEIAHLLCPNQHHTAKWKRTITRMGYGAEVEHCKLTPIK